jgi:hypothetical protein
MITYKLKKSSLTNEINSVVRSDGWSIPFDESNTDYQAYLTWLAEGNTPEPPEESA